MLSAFTARPLVELKQRDKSRIESALAYGDRLLVGLSTGSLRIYRVNEEGKQDQKHDEETSNQQRPTSQSNSRPVDLLREQEKFSKYKIEQLALIKEANVLLSLSNGYIYLHDLQDYTLQETLSKSKGAASFAVTSNTVKDPSTDVNSLVTRLAVAIKRRLLIWTWRDGELEAEVSDQALVTNIKSLTWATATRIVAGLNASYVLFDIETSTVTDIVGPGSIGGAPGQDGGRLGATGVAGMSYLGMTVPKPLATKLGDGEMLLARDINTHFIDLDANPLGRRQIPWMVAPEVVGYSYPYLLALQASKGTLELRNPQTLTLLQSMPLPSANQLHIPHSNISLDRAAKGFLVLSERTIWRMHAQDYDSQIDQLVERGALDEAISLLGMLEDGLLKDKADRMRDTKMKKAQILFDEKRFRESIDLFTEVNAPPERVISLFPPIIAGDASAFAQKDPEPGSPLTLSPSSSNSKDDSIRNDNSEEPTKGSQEPPKQNTSSKVQDAVGHRIPLEGKDLKLATEELRSFLVQSRTRMKKVVNADGTLTREGPEHASSPELGSLLVRKSSNQAAYQESILQTASLVDTTLFRAYMFVSPSFAGPLFRLDNLCDPDVVNEKLIEAGRYNDLVDFFYGKRLHRQALQLLERFGDKEPNNAAPQLAGPQRTVTYLQNLPPEQIDLILEYAEWPLKRDPEMGMQVFLADTENAESLPRERVLQFLSSISSDLSLKYLQHLTTELNDTTPSFHQKLAETYVEGLQNDTFPHSAARKEWEQKTLEFLRTSRAYTAYKVLNLLSPDEPRLYEPRAIVLGNMGQHKQALEIYVFKLQSPVKAEEYCNSVYLTSTTQHRPPSPSRHEDPDDGKSSIYHTLLSLYLKPPPSVKREPNWQAALSLLAKHGARMPASSTLSSIPETIPVKEMESYFRGQIRSQRTAANEAKIVAGLRAVEAGRVEFALRLGEVDDGLSGEKLVGGGRKKGRNRRVLVEEERVCGVCYRRFGGSAVKVLPDDRVVHYGCAAK